MSEGGFSALQLLLTTLDQLGRTGVLILPGLDTQTRSYRSSQLELTVSSNLLSKYIYLALADGGCTVPIYNGTVNPFTLSTYHNLERYSEELQENSVVMVTFTIGAYPLSADKVPLDAMPGLDTRVSFNIKDVVLIAPSSVDFREKNPSGEEPWGVERIEDLWQGETEDNGETNPILEQEI